MSAGIQSVISIAKESSWGSPAVPSQSIPVRPTGGLAIKNNIVMVPAVKGQLQRYYDSIKGKVAYEGDYTFDVFADMLGYFLLSAFGTDTPALHAGETIVYDHVFTESVPKPSLTVEEAIGENIRRFAGSIVDTLKFTGKVGEMLEVVASIKAKTQNSNSAVTPSFSTVPAFNYGQVTLKIGGSTVGEVENIELTYKNGTELVYALGNVEPSYASIQGGSEVSGKLDLYLDSTTLTELTDYIAKTSRSLELIATGGTIGSAAAYALSLLIPKAIYTTAVTKITDAHNLLSLEFQGVYDTSTSELIKPKLTNLVASY